MKHKYASKSRGDKAYSVPQFQKVGGTCPSVHPTIDAHAYMYSVHVSDTSPEAWKVFIYTFPAPEKYLYTLLRSRRSIYTNFSGAGEVFIYTYLAPEKYLYTPLRRAFMWE